MQTTELECGLTVIESKHGAVTSGGARVAICEADGETVIETSPSRATAIVRAGQIARERAACKRWAAIGSDGIRLVVWGMGETAEAALAEAREGILEAGSVEVELVTREISAGDVEAIKAGDVDAGRLGRR